MKAILLILLLAVPSYRIDDMGELRMRGIIPVIEQVAKEIPVWVIAGVVYNESNGRPKALGDNGRAYGLGQIHCGKGGFSWRKFLAKKGIIKKCSDLYDIEKNIKSINAILVYLYEKDKRLDRIITRYHKGEKRKYRPARSYLRNVKYFGNHFVRRQCYESWQFEGR